MLLLLLLLLSPLVVVVGVVHGGVVVVVVELVKQLQHRLEKGLVTQQGVGLVGLQQGLVQDQLLVPELVRMVVVNLVKGEIKIEINQLKWKTFLRDNYAR